jgi:hypothetical protein
MSATKNNSKVMVDVLKSLGISHSQADDLLWFSERTGRSMKKLLRWAVADFLETGALVELGRAYRERGITAKTHPDLFEQREYLTDAQLEARVAAEDKAIEARRKAAKKAAKSAAKNESLFDRQVRASLAYLEK